MPIAQYVLFYIDIRKKCLIIMKFERMTCMLNEMQAISHFKTMSITIFFIH